jgi:Ulp1 family protease
MKDSQCSVITLLRMNRHDCVVDKHVQTWNVPPCLLKHFLRSVVISCSAEQADDTAVGVGISLQCMHISTSMGLFKSKSVSKTFLTSFNGIMSNILSAATSAAGDPSALAQFKYELQMTAYKGHLDATCLMNSHFIFADSVRKKYKEIVG